MKHAFIDFKEVFKPVEGVGMNANLLSVSPSGLVPCVRDSHGDIIWDSMSICEWAHEHAAPGAVWPLDTRARAFARSAASEMHSGYNELRNLLSMHIGMQMPSDAPLALPPKVKFEVDRILRLWAEAREKFGKPSGAGPYLCGAFSAADAMFAPVIFRFQTYRVAIDEPVAKAYYQAMLADPCMQEWENAALAETSDPIEKYENHLRSLGAVSRS